VEHALQDQVAVVTGGSRGIGRAICLSLARDGAHVVAIARDLDRLTALANEAREAELPGSITPCRLDVSDRAGIDEAVKQIVAERDRIDILVNNAGITRDGLLATMDDDQFDEVLTVNLRSAFWLLRAVVRTMISARRGRIVNVSSISGITGNAGQANYAASKAGLIGLTKSVAKELGKRNITCNAVAPGFIATDMTDGLPEKTKEAVKPHIPLRRFGTSEEVAAAVRYLVGPEAGYVTGHVLVVDGGLSM